MRGGADGTGSRTGGCQVLAALACGLALLGANASGARAESPIGAHSMLQLNSPYPFMQTMFAEAASMHASAIRLDLAPALIFPAGPGQPDFSGLDRFMALAQLYRLRVVADLLTIPPWMAACPGPVDVPARCPPNDLAQYGAMVGQIVAHAAPVIRDWEVWNEPDTGAFFNGTPDQYAWMLRTAYGAVKAADPASRVLLGGLSGPGARDWLEQVLATPGADAGQAFDIANVHERGPLNRLPADILAWRWFFAARGFNGPLWVTEHGYPADSMVQPDPGYASGPASQSAYLTASIPTLLDAGAAAVFVTERDNLGGVFGSEGVLGGAVSDPPGESPQVIEKPAFAAVRAVADCYVLLNRDCPGRAPASDSALVRMPAAKLRSSSRATVGISDPGPAPLKLAPVSVTARGVSVTSDGCPGLIVPGQSCAVQLRFTPATGGAVAGALRVPSDSGTLSVRVSGVAPSVSELTWRQRARAGNARVGGAGQRGGPTQMTIDLKNPLSTTVQVTRVTLFGQGRSGFSLSSNHCRARLLRSGQGCSVSLRYLPSHPGTARAVLTLRGDGLPLVVPLRPTGSRQRPGPIAPRPPRER